MKKILLALFIIFLIILSGCARTVTQKPKGFLGIEIKFYNPLVLKKEETYYALVIALNKSTPVSEESSTWQYFILYDGYNQQFKWGTEGDLKSLQDFSFYGNVSESYDIFKFKIPLNIFGGILNTLYIGVFYFEFDPYSFELLGSSWGYVIPQPLDLSIYPFEDLYSSENIESLRVWTE
ncbi:MAG: hypothetical protein ACK4SU_01135 [Dictyoglomus sp.]